MAQYLREAHDYGKDQANNTFGRQFMSFSIMSRCFIIFPNTDKISPDEPLRLFVVNRVVGAATW